MPAASRRLAPSGALDLRRTLSPLVRGAGDPSHRWVEGTFWRVSRTVDGPATLAVRRLDDGTVEGRAWGGGADVVLEGLPDLLGADDDWSGLDVRSSRLLHDVLRSHPGLRLTRTGSVFDVLLAAVLEQKVTGGEARRAWRQILLRHGEPAPGPAGTVPAGLHVPPTPAAVREITTWEWHRYGVDAKRMRTARAVSAVAARLEECCGMTTGEAVARLRLVPGVGPWTAAETVQRALGCPDTVSVGDVHIPNQVVHVLTGAPRGTDEQMMEVLAPWRGQRQRVVRLVELSGVRPPKWGPRYSPLDVRAM